MRRSRLRMGSKRWLILASVILLLVLTSCAAGRNVSRNVPDTSGDIAGFWLGLWQGIIAPITFFVSLFTSKVNVYEVHNNGNWYNLGFVLGAGILLGGGGIMGRRRRRRD
jgi:LPXTG-motif cell wall-anchored protein